MILEQSADLCDSSIIPQRGRNRPHFKTQGGPLQRGASAWTEAGVTHRWHTIWAQGPGLVLLNITVPDGVQPGQQLHVLPPDGQPLAVTVPEGCAPGQCFG